MGKNVVICLDGTGNQVQADASTNVVRLYELLDLSDPTRQVAYYDPGVGTFSAHGAWTPAGRAASRLLGLAFGVGLRQNLAEAYGYLMRQWDPGDRLFIFGFSRGAFGARGLAGLIYRAGIFRAGSENLVPYVVASYTGHRGDWSDEDWRQIDRMSAAFARTYDGSRSAPVEFLGLWDSVRAAGILRRSMTWPYTRQLPNVAHAWHAVSMDEVRRPYREYLIQATERTVVNEVWFAGVHSDVGGTFADDPRLSEITLRWMADGALRQGLLVRPAAYHRQLTLGPEHADGAVHHMGGLWPLLTTRRRSVPAGARVHSSVKKRTFPPDHAEFLPADVVWEDEAWPTPPM
jgi:uncharacterized protein (DUF2235 family)